MNFGALRVNSEGVGGFAGTVTLYGMGRSGWSSVRRVIDTADGSLGMGRSDAEQIERMPSGSKHNEVYVKIDPIAPPASRTGCSMVKYGVDAGAMRLKSLIRKSVPKVPSDSTGQQRRFAEAVSDNLDTLTGRRGSL